eukprot:7022363-Alexandrium_andersonii.AAC.1
MLHCTLVAGHARVPDTLQLGAPRSGARSRSVGALSPAPRCPFGGGSDGRAATTAQCLMPET